MPRAADADEARNRFGHRVGGSYAIAVDLGGSPILALATLNASGGVVATDTDDFGFDIDQSFHSPKHGLWKRTGKRRMSITLYELGFLKDGTNAPFVVFKLSFDATFDSKALQSGSGTVAYTAHLLDSPDPLDLDGGAAHRGRAAVKTCSASRASRRSGGRCGRVLP